MSINFDQKQQGVVVFLVLLIVGVGFGGKKIWQWQGREVINIENKISDIQKKMDLANEINEYSFKLNKSTDLSWKTKESVVIMGEVSNLSGKYDVEILNINPGGLKDEGYYYIFSLTLNLRAEYAMLARFISAIERLSTLTKIIAIELAPEEMDDPYNEKNPKIKVNLVIKAFIIK